MSDSKPTYIYKLVPFSSTVPSGLPENPPVITSDLPERLPVSTIDQQSGFIHLSTAPQVPGTLKFFFASDSRVYVLRLKYDDVEKNIRWEDPKAEVCGPRGGEGMFPHLYNDLKLGKEEIESVSIWDKGENGWDEALEKAESWLVY